MEIAADLSSLTDSVNHDEPPVAQVEVDGVEYRVDVGLGSAVAISSREQGTWAWTVLGEGKWDGLRFRSRALERPVCAVLERALAAAMRERSEL